MITLTAKGLYCRAGDFYIDPKRVVENAVITHAHSDHARKGSKRYFCVNSGVSLLKARLGQHIVVQAHGYGENFYLNDVKISFHGAGHILGSSQIRIEYLGEVWVVSGDYKREPDPTCEPFEIVPCDVFITEATFGTPAFRWEKTADLGKEIFDWWNTNAEAGVNSLLYAYSLGKTQRILGELAALTEKTIYCDPKATEINDCYRSQGMKLAATVCLSTVDPSIQLSGELLIAPFSFMRTPAASLLGKKYKTAFASGWARTRTKSFDKNFLMSDHADWDDLLRSIEESQAKRVYVQHRGQGALIRKLKTLGVKAQPDTALIPKYPNQLTFF
jgi:putative mRNA 3-end processing factor